MDKLYYQQINWYDYPIFLVYNIILSFLILRISDAGFNLDKRSRFLVLLQFQILFFLVIANIFWNFLPVAQGSHVFVELINTGQYPQSSTENILPFYYLSIFLNMLSLNSVVIFLFISFFIFSLSSLFFASSVQRLFPTAGRKPQQLFLMFNLIYPAIYLFYTSPLRDIYLLFFFSIFIQAIVKYRSHGRIMPLIITGAIVSLINFIYIPFVAIVIIYMLSLRIKLKWRLYIAAGLVILGVFTMAILQSNGINPEWMAEQRNKTLFDTGQYTYGMVHWSNYTQILADELLLGLQFLFAPLPIFSGYSITGNIPMLIDVIYVVLLTLVLIVMSGKISKNNVWLLIIFLLFIFYFGSTENDLELAVRHRIPGIELLFILLSGLFYKQKHQHA